MSRKLQQRRTHGKEWWANQTDEQKQAFIAWKERTRKATRKDRTGERETLPNGLVKIWNNANSYSIYKPHMLNQYGYPLPEFKSMV